MAGDINFPAPGNDGQEVNIYNNAEGGISDPVVLKPHKKAKNCDYRPVSILMQFVSFLSLILWQNTDTHHNIANGDQNHKEDTNESRLRK
jgi:hypothetical protein